MGGGFAEVKIKNTNNEMNSKCIKREHICNSIVNIWTRSGFVDGKNRESVRNGETTLFGSHHQDKESNII